MKRLISTKAYGVGEYISHDPRFPGYISAKFNIKGKEIIINNLRKRDIYSICEEDYVKCHKQQCIYDEFNSKNDVDDVVLLWHELHFNPHENITDFLTFNLCKDYWEISFPNNETLVTITKPDEYYDVKNFMKFEDFKY